MVDCTYPDLTQLKNKDAFRLATINTRLASLTDRIERDREKLTKKRRRHKKLVSANVILTGVGVACSTVGGALSGTGVGVMVGGPAIGVGAACGIGALITLHLCKTSNHELYQQLVTLGQAKISFLQKLVSKALSDESVSEEQFDEIIDEFAAYESERSKLTRKKALEGGAKNGNSTTELSQQVANLISTHLKKRWTLPRLPPRSSSMGAPATAYAKR